MEDGHFAVQRQMSEDINTIKAEMTEALTKGYGPKVARFALALLGGVPFVGGAFGGAAGAWSEAEQDYFNKVAANWLKLQEDEIREIGVTIAEILSRLDLNDTETQRRIESPEYLSLIKKCFRDWSAAESEEKRVYVRNLLTTAATSKICNHDVVRMFIQWIDNYSELHLKVVRWIYKHRGCTRMDMWIGIYGERVREDSAEADMFKLLIRDLSTGSVIRQHREKDYSGNWIKKTRPPRRGTQSQTLKSAFDDEEEYELTELGTQFVRYTVEGAMPKIAAPSGTVYSTGDPATREATM
jgi:hypothetical protein